ncbi:MAG: energy transducer TonB [Bacteroidetes bacterium HGW-Bacteroidetes-12]|nr:MAG: energy transducer TonB [Bacteroidetes bacterium HGW-Bacteroidetes-12]
MKTIQQLFLVMLFTFMGSISFAQEVDEKEDIFILVEQMPEFPGGQEAMFKFLAKNIIYPKEAKEKGIEGKVYVNFTVNEDGSIGNVKVIRGVHPLLNNEAVRVIESFPKWTPGKQKGELVRVSYNLPITFRMSNSEDKKEKLKEK